MKNKSIKVATKREALFMTVRDAAKNRLAGSEDAIEVEKELIKMAERIIKEENAL